MKDRDKEHHCLRRFLLVRTDRIGDVILSMPVATAIKQTVPGVYVALLCRQETAVIGERNPDVDEVITIDTPEGRRRSFFELVDIVRSGSFDCALIIHPTFAIALAIAKAGISVRVGTGYRWYSYLFSECHYEHRKKSVKHEADYNLGLLQALHFPPVSPVFRFVIQDEDRQNASAALTEIGIGDDEPFCVVHPGSGGSAMDWPLKYYAAACDLFIRRLNLPVVVSWGSHERELAEKVQQQTSGDVRMLPGILSLPALAALLHRASFLLAPSTGILHLSNTVGTPVIGLYPPIPHESPTRWGPYGNTAAALVPKIEDCPTCSGTKCRNLRCMELITPEMVLDTAQEIYVEMQ